MAAEPRELGGVNMREVLFSADGQQPSTPHGGLKIS